MALGAIVLLTLVASSEVGAVTLSQARAECVVDRDGLVECGFGCVTSPRGQADCAQEPGGACIVEADGNIVCSEPTGLSLRLPLVNATCKKGADGSVACGYHCVVDGAGLPVCANTSDGACSVSPQGHVRCTEFSVGQRIVVLTDRVEPECRRDATGGVQCGFGCAKSPSGQVRCASTVDGACMADKAGALVCTDLDPRQRLFVGAPPEAQCLKGADGHASCGYGCVRETTGRARCSSSPLGICATGADGHARCFPDDD